MATAIFITSRVRQSRSPVKIVMARFAVAQTYSLRVRLPRRRLDKQRNDANHKTDRKSTRLNSSHSQISYAVFCLKKKKKKTIAAHTLDNVRTRRAALCY